MTEEKKSLGVMFLVPEMVAKALQEADDKLTLTVQDAAMGAFSQLMQQEGLDMDDYSRTLELGSITKSEDGEYYKVTFKLRPKS